MAGAGTLARKSGVRQTHRRDAVFLFQIPLDKGFRRVLIPVGKPGEDQQTWALDFVILSRHDKWPAAHGDAAHCPFAAGAQIRLDVGYLESAFGAPPFHTLSGIGQGLERSVPPGILW